MDQRRQAPGVAIETMRFDSGSFPADARFDAYRAFNGSVSEATRTGPDFETRVQRWRLDRLVLHERWSNDVAHEREAARCTDGVDHFLMHLVRSGDYQVDTGGGLRAVLPGSVLLLDMRQPMRTVARRAHVVSVSMARDMLAELAEGAAALHGRILPQGASLPLADLLVSLTARAATLPATVAVGVSQAIVTLASVALEQQVAPFERREGPADAGTLDRARRLIEARLHDSRLDAGAIAAQTGLSRATLYRLFKPYGGLMSYLRARRLDRLRIALSDPDDLRPLPQMASEAGFTNESHCSRLFVAAFGIRPSAYRERQARLRASVSGDARLDHWLSELR